MGQAIVLDQGQTTAGLSYQHTFVRYHISYNGTKADLGHIMSYAIRPEVSYGLTDRITLDSDATFSAAKYIWGGGTFPASPHGRLDDGTFHATLQDFHLGLRANLLMRPVVLTPFARLTIPSHHYELHGHTAVGRDKLELTFGTWAGRDLGPLAPNVFIEGMASHTLVQRTTTALASARLNRTNGSLEVGYYLTPAVTLRAFGNGLRTHGGWTFAAPPPDIEEHDRFDKSKDIVVGGAVSYTFRSGLTIYTGYFKTVWARTAHGLAGPTIGLTWTPRPRQSWLAQMRTRPAFLLAQQ
ncbi:MAG: hypothetical protein M3P29_05745 [Acidobacteriota bacterium]|nr:hypothetical protein [Acidobacteriota bacterium]